MEDILKFIGLLCAAIIGLIIGLMLSNLYIRVTYTEPMDALGIERFQKCEINTTNCHSNWYEIVYKKEKQK